MEKWDHGGMRNVVTPKQLRAILVREFAKSQPRRCWFSCRIPTPLWRDPPNGESPNWFIPEMAKCARGCDSLLAHIASRLKRDFNITPPLESVVARLMQRDGARS